MTDLKVFCPQCGTTYTANIPHSAELFVSAEVEGDGDYDFYAEVEEWECVKCGMSFFLTTGESDQL
jgi:ribosomal protein S27AE